MAHDDCQRHLQGGRLPAFLMLLFGAIGVLCGSLSSLVVSAYSLYACTVIL
jgi:hypothetical protein